MNILFDNQWVPFNKIKKYNPKNDTELRVIEIIKSWTAGIPNFQFKTSGSTGLPKIITVKREQLLSSSQATSKALNLKSNQTALIAINPRFIGGTMMVIRALENDMNLIVKEPSSNPLDNINEQIHFAAFVPMQLHEIMNSDATREKLNGIDNIIIGGGAVSQKSIKEIQNLTCDIYATYGMTETVSHIALQKLNGNNKIDFFIAFDTVELSKDERGCLIINGPQTDFKNIITNDLVELINKKEFKWLGRIDNVINTGGIKVNSEQLEKNIEELLVSHNINLHFFLAGISDQKLGEKIVLFIQGKEIPLNLKNILKTELPKYEHPKEIIPLSQFIYTNNDKIDRAKTIETYLSNN